MKLKEKIINIRIPSMLLYAFPVLFIFTIVLLAYWPGILVSDFVVQWDQIQNWKFDDWHPAYNTLYIGLLSKIWSNPGFIIFIQCIWMSLAVGYFFSRIEKYYNINKRYLLGMSFVFAIIPLNFNFAVTLLKDTLYSTFIIFFIAIIIDMINDKDFFKKKLKCLFLLFVLLIISLFRHNGIIVVGLMGIVLCIIYKKQKMVYLIFGLWLIIHLTMTTLGYKVLNIQKNNYANKFGPVSHLMARMLNTDGVEFTDEEMQILSEYTDVEKLKTTFNQYNMDYSINSQNMPKIKESGNEYLKFGIKKSLQYPMVAIKHYIHLTSFLYSPIAFKGSTVVGMYIKTDLWIYKDIYPNLNENSKLPMILPIIKFSEKAFQAPFLKYITISPAIYMYLSIIMIYILSRIKKNKKIWLMILPIIFNIISLIPAIPVPMTRYVYATMFGFFCYITWFIYEIYTQYKKKKKIKKII